MLPCSKKPALYVHMKSGVSHSSAQSPLLGRHLIVDGFACPFARHHLASPLRSWAHRHVQVGRFLLS